MRPVSAEYEINQPFGSMATAGVAASLTPDTVGYYVHLYGNYQPYGHAGLDIACPEGTPVHAIASGAVLWADWGTNLPGDESNAGYRKRWYLYKGFPGIVTVIQHDGWIGVYAHLSAAHMNPGDTVTEGQQIGLSGGTGGVAPHLHVEALVDLNYPTGGGLIYGRTNPEPHFGGIAAMGSTITPVQEDIMAFTPEQEQFILASLGSLVDNVATKKDVASPGQIAFTETALRSLVENVATKADLSGVSAAVASAVGAKASAADIEAAVRAGMSAGLKVDVSIK